jgi:DNA transposition AAA+ family ATPase
MKHLPAWDQLRNIHDTGIVELILCGNPKLEKNHHYRWGSERKPSVQVEL